MKLYDTQGLTGCVVRYNNRFNGRLVAIYHAAQAGLGEEGWATVCEDHNSIQVHKTLTLAKKHVAYPPGWCERCAVKT
jgi:hypothetical protein